MFAVKGWNVDASALKLQTEPFKARKAPDQDGSKQSRKRKREDANAQKEQDVGKLWEQHIEGKESNKLGKTKKKEKKRQKLDSEDATKGKPAGGKALDASGLENLADKAGAHEEPSSKDRKDKKKQKQKQKRQRETDSSHISTSKSQGSAKRDVKDAAPPVMPPLTTGTKLTPMQSAMRQKLVSARFRHLNQTLYTEPSVKAVELFDQNPEMFEDYHSGFRQQVAVWPENPVDNFIATITSRGKVRLISQKQAFKGKKRQSQDLGATERRDGNNPALPRIHGTCIIADLGCGDARLAQTLKDSGDGQKLQLKVSSYDLHSPSPLVTKADISKLPTADGSVDVAIFCLALMGTNWISFIEEAYRILHWKGELWVAEIKSRFGRVGRAGKAVEHSVGGKRKQAAIKKAQEAKKREQEDVNEQETLAVEVDGAETVNTETDVSAFVDVLSRRGFVLKNGDSSIDLSNKMFVKMEFIKAATPTKGKNKPDEKSAKPVERFKKSKAKFLDEDSKDDVTTEDEGKVLKPCLYKIR